MAGGVPMMMHITDSPIPLPELLAHMKPGDIVTHCYHGRAHGIMGQEKQLILNANADDPSQVPYHGVWPGLGLLLQSFLTSLLDLLDLADDEAQPRYIALQLGRDIRRQRRALRRV
jgi:hypothetical protein